MIVKKRRGIAVALVIFAIAFIAGGFIMIIFDQLFQATTAWELSGPFSTGVYNSNVLLFFQDVWAWFALVILIVLSVWLYLRSQESSVGQD